MLMWVKYKLYILLLYYTKILKKYAMYLIDKLINCIDMNNIFVENILSFVVS